LYWVKKLKKCLNVAKVANLAKQTLISTFKTEKFFFQVQIKKKSKEKIFGRWIIANIDLGKGKIIAGGSSQFYHRCFIIAASICNC